MADLKFAIWETWARTFEQMDDATLATVFRAMYRFAFDGEVPDFEPGTIAALVWPMIETSIERSVKVTRRNQENGAKHTGKPTEEPKGKPKQKPTAKPNSKPTENPSDNPTENLGYPNGKPEEKRNRREGKGNKNLEGFISLPTAGAGADAGGPAPRPSGWVCPRCHSPAYPDGDGWKCPKHGPIPAADPAPTLNATECPASVLEAVRAARVP